MALKTKPSLANVVFHSRLFGYLLAALALTQLERSLYLYGWIIFVMSYPFLLQWFVTRSGATHRVIKISMFIDAVIVGLLISLIGYQVEASVVLVSIYSVSVLIVGGWPLLVGVVPLLLSGMLSGSLNHPMTFTGDASFYFVSFGILAAYVSFVGMQVYQETRRLKLEQRAESGMRQSLERMSQLVTPFVPPQILSRMRTDRPQRRRVTVMFVDIVHSKGTIDRWDDQFCMQLLEAFSDTVVNLTQRYEITLDKFLGPGAMLYAGEPITKGTAADARSCVQLSEELHRAFSAFSFSEKLGKPQLRIGIHSGTALVGEFGGRERRDLTAIGQSVSFAHRLKSAAEPGETLLSADTVALVRPDFRAYRRGCVFDRLHHEKVVAFSLIGRGTCSGGVRVSQGGQHV